MTSAGTYIMRLVHLMVIAGLALGTVPLKNAVAQSGPNYSGLMQSVDLPGRDYRNLSVGDAAECSSTCEAENQCRAWTYDMLTHRCWLKDAAPKRVYNFYCISGFKEGGLGRTN